MPSGTVTRLPVRFKRPRAHPEATTVAYIAMGVRAALERASAPSAGGPPQRPNLDRWSGELGFVGEIVEPWALALDRLADAHMESGGEFAGCFAYEVAEEFGSAYAEALLRNTQEDPFDIAQRVFKALAIQ